MVPLSITPANFGTAKFALCKRQAAVIFAALFSNLMNVVVENLPHCLATLKVELEPERVSETWNAVANDFGKYAKIAGYRAGKVPRGILNVVSANCWSVA